MQLGVSLEPPRWPAAGGAMALQTAVRAERLGLHYVLMSDHVLSGGSGGAGLDAFTLLAAVAGATSRIRLATSVLVLPYRHPLLVAGQAATLDSLSGGRFALGTGTGWNEQEYTALGLEVRRRGSLTDEYLTALRALWSGEPVNFDGRHLTLDGAEPAAQPRTKGGPPIWIGGHSDAALRRALRFGDGWHGSGVDETGLRDIRRRLDHLGEHLDRDPGELKLSSVCFLVPPGFEPTGPLPGPPLVAPEAGTQQILDALGRLQAGGLSMVSLWMPLDPHQLLDALDWVAAELLPQLPDRAA
jgi:probable F420-dependent oxidoreductase